MTERITPTDLRALRIGLGMDAKNAADFFGFYNVQVIIDSERPRGPFVDAMMLERYRALEAVVSAYVDKMVQHGKDIAALIGFLDRDTFPHVPEYEQFGRSAQVYMAALSRSQIAIESYWGRRVPIVAFVRLNFERFYGLTQGDRLDLTAERLSAWAEHYLSGLKVRAFEDRYQPGDRHAAE